MAGRDEPAEMLLEVALLRELASVAAWMLGHELRRRRKLGNRVLGVELAVFDIGHELLPARVVRPEELHLAVVERASQRIAHGVGGTALGLQRVARRPLQRTNRALQRDVGRDHEVLRRVQQRGQDRALELALGLFARKALRVFGRALCEEQRALRRALAPRLDHLGVANHLDVGTVLLLGHVGIARPHHLAHHGVELVYVRRPEQLPGKPAPGHAAEVALRRLAVDLPRVVVVPEMRAKHMGHDVGLGKRCEPAGLALVENRRRLALRGAGRYLQQHRRRVVEKEVREVLQLVGVDVLLDAADDRPQGLRLRQQLDLGVERTLARHELPAVAGLPAVAPELLAVAAELFAVAPERFPVNAKLLAVGKGSGPLLGTPAPPCVRRRRTDLSDANSSRLPRPFRREVDGPQIYNAALFAHDMHIIP